VHWSVDLTYLRAAGWESNQDACNPKCAAIIDSGTSLIVAPTTVIQALAPVLDQIDPACGNLEQLPDITFVLGSERFEIPPAIYVIKLKMYEEKNQTGWDAMWGPPEKVVVIKCVAAFQEANIQSDVGPVLILGSPFLRYFYTVFQRRPKSIHFAYSTSDCMPTNTKPSIYNLGNATRYSKVQPSTKYLHSDSATNHFASIPTIEETEARRPTWAKYCRNSTQNCFVRL